MEVFLSSGFLYCFAVIICKRSIY